MSIGSITQHSADPGSGLPAGPGLALPAPRSRIKVRLPRSGKVLLGLGGVLAFLIVAIIGSWVAPYSPSQTFSTTASFPLPPSSAHWLGTTQQQQDVLSQLLAGDAAPSWLRSWPGWSRPCCRSWSV